MKNGGKCRRAARRGCNSAKAAADRFGGTGISAASPGAGGEFYALRCGGGHGAPLGDAAAELY